jgi:hypothetical protein
MQIMTDFLFLQIGGDIDLTSDNGWVPTIQYAELGIRLLFNLITAFILIRLIYYTSQRNRDYLFTFFLFNFLIFLICALLSTATIKIGLAFGLFAIFSVLRYRTVTIPIKEMGYLFACVAVGVINALALPGDYYLILLVCNALILLMAWSLDHVILLNHEHSKEVIYERIDLIHVDKMDEMKEDLIRRTGLPIHRIEIISINFLRDIATLQVYYYSEAKGKSQNLLQVDDD